jgi:hypothetical protein
VQFEVECDLVQYEIKAKTTEGIHWLNLLSENNFEGVEYHPRRTTCHCLNIQNPKLERKNTQNRKKTSKIQT